MRRALNLMSEKARKRDQIRCCVHLWSRIFGVVMVVLVLVGAAKWHKCRAEQLKQEAANAEYEPIRQLIAENSRLRKEITTIQESERISLALAESQPLLGLVGLASQAISEHDQKVYLQQLAIDFTPTLDAVQAAQTDSRLSFLIEGISIDSSAITTIAKLLKASGPFRDVELTTDDISRVGKQAQQAFSIECTN